MTTYQVLLYKVALIDFELGWDYTGDILFESNIYEEPGMAMKELSFFTPSHNNWFANMRVIEDWEIIEEEIFDSSVIEVDYPYY